jgi:hypothetical protein
MIVRDTDHRSTRIGVQIVFVVQCGSMATTHATMTETLCSTYQSIADVGARRKL